MTPNFPADPRICFANFPAWAKGPCMADLYALEQAWYAEGFQVIAGADEVGRGCIAGPVYAGAVILPANLRISGLNDSKQLTAAVRERLNEIIRREALAWSIASVDVEEIDRINILWAAMKAMRLAVEGLTQRPELLLIDGNRATDLELPQKAVVGGDARCATIAAASVIAKVERDRWMAEQEASFPGFSFAKHKGYGTEQHLRELREHGPTPLHRRSFAPVQELL